MTIQILIGLGLLIVSVVVQVVSVLVTLRFLLKRRARGRLGQTLAYDVWVLSMVMVVLFLGHLLQIAMWAWLFVRLGEFPDFAVAFYHSTVNFASLGYGDIVMSERWKLLGALEAGNGVLMFSLSAAFMFAILTRFIEGFREKLEQK